MFKIIVGNIDPIRGDCDLFGLSNCNKLVGCYVGNIDPIRGDCDMASSKQNILPSVKSLVGNIDPIRGDCDPSA